MKRGKIMKNKNYELRVVLICAVSFILLTIFTIILNNVQAAESITYKNYTVRSGETIWNIACNLDKDENIQKTIYDIRKDNNNLDPIIYPGQVIKIREVK